MDHDLREYQREIALSSISARDTSKKLAPLKTKSTGRKSKAVPLFEPEEEEISPVQNDDIGSEDDEELAIAIQASMDSGPTVASHSPLMPNATRSSPLSFHRALNSDSMFQVSTSLQTALSIANAGPSPRLVSPSRRRSSLPLYNPSSISLQRIFDPPPLVSAQNISDSDDGLQQTPVRSTAASVVLSEPISDASSDEDMEEIITSARSGHSPQIQGRDTSSAKPSVPSLFNSDIARSSIRSANDEFRDIVPLPDFSHKSLTTPSPQQFENDDAGPSDVAQSSRSTFGYEMESEVQSEPRSPSPLPEPSTISLQPSLALAGAWDPAQEMDLEAEEGEFARFVSHVKGKNIEDVRREIDDEIKTLNQQKRAAMRDSEEITQQMIAQIMVYTAHPWFCVIY
jgi:DNA excision repair protein ERCC-5